MMRLAIITSGYLPVPASKGGAVENLAENFIKENEKKEYLDITVFSIYEEKARERANKYRKTNTIFIKTPKIIKAFDRIIYFCAKNILKKEKTMSYRYICQRLHYLNNVSKYLKKNEYDKVLIENHATLFLALKWRKNYKKYEGKYYYHLHNEITNDFGCIEIIKQSKKIICVSNYIVNQTKKRLELNNSQDKFDVLKNCIDENEFINKISKNKIDELRNKYSINKNDKVLLFTGRLTREKGIRELLLAIRNVKTNNFKLLIVGSFFFDTNIKNEFECELSSIIKDIKEKVIFTGFISYEDIPNIYKLADIAVLPSIWDDPAPLTIIEALKSGLPIITTFSGGIPEYVSKECSIILDKNDNDKLVKELSKNIEILLVDENKIKGMSRKSVEISKNLTLENYYMNFLKKIELKG